MTNWWGKVEMKIATPGSSSTPDGVGFKNNNRQNEETRNQAEMPARQESYTVIRKHTYLLDRGALVVDNGCGVKG